MLAIVLLAVLGVSVQVNAAAPTGCCNMDFDDTCAWSLTPPWQSSLIGPPITTLYPGFAHVSDYLYLQDSAGGILDSTAPIYIESQYTIISLDYYFNTPNPSPESYIYVYFVPQGSSNRMPIFDTSIPIDNWIHKDVPCNDKNNYCCGLLSRFPCYGTIEVVGSLAVLPPTGLIAVDNVGTCVTTQPCCNFDSSAVCGYTNEPGNPHDWYWSYSSPPVSTIPPPTTYTPFVYYEVQSYLPGTVEYSYYRSDVITIPSNVNFVGDFFVRTPYGQSSSSGLEIRFVNSDSGKKTKMAFYPSTSEVWQTLSFSCNTTGNCCGAGASTCSGWLEFEASLEYFGGSTVIAVDYVTEEYVTCA